MKRLARFLLACCAVLACSAETHAERLVRATISMDDKVILEGTTTDDGRTDADGVWEYLKSMKFQDTSAFAGLDVLPMTTVVSLSTPKGKGGTIMVEIDFGGRVLARELKFVRPPGNRQGRKWSLDATQVDKMFNQRFILRSEAAKLEKPKGLRR